MFFPSSAADMLKVQAATTTQTIPDSQSGQNLERSQTWTDKDSFDTFPSACHFKAVVKQLFLHTHTVWTNGQIKKWVSDWKFKYAELWWICFKRHWNPAYLHHSNSHSYLSLTHTEYEWMI